MKQSKTSIQHRYRSIRSIVQRQRSGRQSIDPYWKYVIWAICAFLLVISFSTWQPPVLAQLPYLGQPQSGSQPPYDVERLGLIEVTDVNLDGQELFKIASPTILDRNKPDGQVPVEVRAQQIEANLNLLISPNPPSKAEPGSQSATVLDPETLQVYFNILNSQPVLYVKDAYLLEPKVLLTVTDADAQYYASSKTELAKRWQKILERELYDALERRQPGAFKHHVLTAIGLLVAALLSTLLFRKLWRFSGRRQQALEQEHDQTIAQVAQSAEDTINDERQQFQLLQRLRQRLSLQQQLQILRFFRWLLFWAIAFVWILGIAGSLYRFPQTHQFALSLIATPILILIAWFVAGLIDHLVNIGIDRLASTWRSNEFSTVEHLQRASLRISTIVNVVKGLKTAIVYTLAILWVFHTLKVAPASILALGAILALAVSFAAQNLVKDFVNGFLILLEDQYAIGDKIAVNNISGVVENLNIRITQVRSDSGNLITIPNSQINQVENKSRVWSRSDFEIEVAYDTDVDQALAIVRETSEEMACDPIFGPLILDPKELLGVEHISHSGMVIRIWIRTQPLKDKSVARELRRRLKKVFDRNGIKIGVPQQSISGELKERLEKN